MYRYSVIICSVWAALFSSCRSVVTLSSDGSLTERAVITIAPESQPTGSQAFAAQEGQKGAVRFSVPRSMARQPYTATLVPDYTRTGNEITRRFVPGETKSLLFTPEGITITPRRRK